NGESILDEGVYHLFLSGYADNSIHDVFINGISQGISGGDFTPGGFLQMDLDGPWQAGANFVDILIYNIPNGTFNPYGLLLVADSNAGANSDLDNDGVADFLDECPCLPGNNSNGCPSDEFQFTLCNGESLTLTAPVAGDYIWSTGETSASIIVTPEENTVYELSIVDASQNNSTYIFQVNVNMSYVFMSSIVLCEGQTLIIDGNIIQNSGIYESVYSTIEDCDSVVINEVSILPSSSSTFQFNLCRGDSLIFNNSVYSTFGEFIFTNVAESGCDSLVILDIQEIICIPCRYFFPNIFTPNGDGLNDVFDINEGNCVKDGYLVEIYNRWGMQVYSSNSPEQYWNGQYQGELCSDGTYYYVSNYIDEGGIKRRKTGYLQLLAND
ncbi:MAG: gliding motility-associated C-terminal domain-containing protein, partial [Flavobacteriales bacterium]